MKKLIHSAEDIFGMANLNPRKSGLSVIIWSDHSGVSRKVENNSPRIKIGKNDDWVVVTIESEPKILQKSSNIKKSDMEDIEEVESLAGQIIDPLLFLQTKVLQLKH